MEYKIGQNYYERKIIDYEQIVKFAEATGDLNPIHLDKAVAARSLFGQIVAHGMLGASFISSVLGTKFPGEGTIYLSQNLKFMKPVYIGDELLIYVEIEELLENNKAKLITNITNQKEELVVLGKAKVILPEER